MDIDLEMESEEPPSKRYRRTLFETSVNENDNPLEVLEKEPHLGGENPKQKVLRRIPAGSYVSSTSADKTRVYMVLKPSLCQDSKTVSNLPSNHRLLPNLFHELRSKIEAEHDSELQAKMSFIKDNVPLAHKNVDFANKSESKSKSIDHSENLWVDKYKPRNFMELLSDDGTNRTLLRWLKLWDKVVFNKEVKLRPITQPIKSHSNFKSFNNNSSKFKKWKQPLSEELDAMNCPVQKIALLCGPPGLGKTTLAHVIASQAGYNPVEMNASDDRSAEVFRNQIQAATQMQAVFGTERRPNCLIIDEIDGAPLVSINLLMTMVNGKSQENSKQSKSSNKESKNRILPRPIICICNNQYVSSLRPLRISALIINFPSTASSRLASRLMEITRIEDLRTDTSTLMALCEKAENDIRSCISTLQFVTNKQKVLRMTDIHHLACGQKDIQRSLFTLWQKLFQIPKLLRKSPNINGHWEAITQVTKTSIYEISRFDNILRMSQGYNENDKIHQGIFENYPSMKFKDHNMENCVYGSEWLCFADLLQQEIQHSQNYVVMPYLPFATVALHYAFASNAFPRITYPTANFQLSTKVNSCKNVMANITDEISPALRPYVNSCVLVMDLLPLLTHIIQPNFRPVNVQLYSSDEKALFDHVVNIMVNYNVNYKQQVGQDGQYQFVLEPQFDLVSNFPDVKNETMCYGSKQAISHEINMVKMRKEEERRLQAEKTKNSSRTTQAKDLLSSYKTPTLPLKSVFEKPCVDFFGRAIDKSSKIRKQDTLKAITTGDVWFHFKEGYSNATRRKIRMKDLP